MKNRQLTSQGLTLVELLIAIMLIGIVVTAISPALIGNLQINSRSEEKQQAAAAARQVLDLLRAGGTLPDHGSQEFSVTQGRTFDVTAEFCKDSSSLCVGNAVEVYLTVKPEGQEREVLTAETVLTDINVTNAGGTP